MRSILRRGALLLFAGRPRRRAGLLIPRAGAAAFGSPHRQGDALADDVDLDDADLHDIPRLHHFVRVAHEAIGELREVDEAVLVNADVDEGAERGDVGDGSLEPHARLQVLDVVDALGKSRGLELRPGIAARLLQFGDDVAHRRQAESLVDEKTWIERFESLLVAHQRAQIATAGGDDLLGDAVSLGVDGRGVERLGAAPDPEEAGALLERARSEPAHFQQLPPAGERAAGVAVRDDRLTGLYTLAYLQELLKRDWAIAQREQRSIAVFAIDIDALDIYNATFGRAAGDSAIRRVAHCVSGCLRRSSDVTARIEGGNLMAFAPGVDLDRARALADTMAERVRELRIHNPRSGVLRYMSVSVGVCAVVPAADASPDALVEKSQLQLKIAKQLGRNRAA